MRSGQPRLLGTLDNQSVVVLVNNQPTLRLSSVDDVTYTNVVNVVNGSPLNTVGAGVKGATIAGGGVTSMAASNRIKSINFLVRCRVGQATARMGTPQSSAEDTGIRRADRTP